MKIRLLPATLALGLLLPGALVHGQFSDLACTDDASQVYFATGLRLKTEAGLGLRNTHAIYRDIAGRLERMSDPPLYPSFHGNPQVSGDGRVFSYTATTPCVGGSSCILSRPTTYSSSVRTPEQPDGFAVGGYAQISRNGRYVANFGGWSSMAGATTFRALRDLPTGQDIEVDLQVLSHRQALTSDGRIIGTKDPQSESLVLWSTQDQRVLKTTGRPSSAIVNDTGTWIVYATAQQYSTNLRAIELSTGRDGLLAGPSPSAFHASISNDGRLVLYVAEPQPGNPAQAFLIQPDGTGRVQLTDFPEGVKEAVLAGFGKAAVAVTGKGRLVRIDTQTGTVEDLVPVVPPTYGAAFLALTPGSILPIRGTGLADSTEVAGFPLATQLAGVRVLADGIPLPVLSASFYEVWFQVPFDLPLSESVHVELESSAIDLSPFSATQTGQIRVPVQRRRPYFSTDQLAGHLILAHQDFRTLVTRDSPAQPGEIVHAYALGLGYVTPELETGILTPIGPLFRLADPFDCVIRGAQVDVLFAGMAPGMIGIYQVDIRIPDPLPSDSPGSEFLVCGTPGIPLERHGGNVPVQRPK